MEVMSDGRCYAFCRNTYREDNEMKKTAIIYASKHHGSTYKLAAAIAEKYDIV